MRKISILIIINILILYLTLNLFSYDKYAGAFLNNGSSARAISLGKTGFINNFDASSLHWNPALLNNLEGKNVSLMFRQAGMFSLGLNFKIILRIRIH